MIQTSVCVCVCVCVSVCPGIFRVSGNCIRRHDVSQALA